MKRAPSHLRGTARRQVGELHRLPRPGPDDADCRHCDDSGVIPLCRFKWRACECKAGAVVLEQLASREQQAHGGNG